MRRKARQKLSLVWLVQGLDGAVFERAFQKVGVDIEVTNIPLADMLPLTLNRLNGLKKLLKEKSLTRSVIFCPGTIELFLKEADYMLLFSAYRSWYSRKTMGVIPHLWTPLGMPQSTSHLEWKNKPPLRIGFMGRSHSASRLGKMVLRSPHWMKKRFLRGTHLKYPKLMALLGQVGLPLTNINSFARVEALDALKAKRSDYNEIELDLVERKDFKASSSLFDEYSNHLQRNTYIVCPRGTENYSFRIYEALSSGRIPVIIDTDIVLPEQIDWESLAIVVPYDSLGRTYDIILNDYKLRSTEEFLERQRKAFSTMLSLRTMSWVTDVAGKLLSDGLG